MSFSSKVAIYIYIIYILLICDSIDGGTFAASSESVPSISITKKRIIKELRDIGSSEILPCFPFNSTSDEIGVRLHPTSNLLEWHFSFTGIEASPYEGGVYHGRILLPKASAALCITVNFHVRSMYLINLYIIRIIRERRRQLQ